MTFGPPPSPFTASADTARTARRRRTRLLGSVAVAVVAALCAGAGLLAYATGDDPTPAGTRPAAAPPAPG